MNLSTELQTLLSLHGIASLVILSLLEIVLGIDNIIFISLILTKIPEEKRFGTRITALSLAFVMRIIMLFFIVWLSHITTTLFTVSTFNVSIRDILFFIGGAYLTFNTIKELVTHHQNLSAPGQIFYKSIILQIVITDMLFSFDSIFTAIGLVKGFLIMALAIGFGMVFMIYLSGKISVFFEKHPPVKTLALCFVVAIGLLLILQAFHIDLPKKYIYAAFGIAFLVERIYSLRTRSV